MHVLTGTCCKSSSLEKRKSFVGIDVRVVEATFVRELASKQLTFLPSPLVKALSLVEGLQMVQLLFPPSTPCMQ